MTLLNDLRTWLGKLGAPPDLGPIVFPKPATGHAAEEFATIPGERELKQTQDERVASLYQRVVRSNNANVTRNFGDGRGHVVIHRDSAVDPLSDNEIVELAGERTGVKVYDPADSV